MKYSNHGVSLLMVSSQAFYAIILRFFNIWDVLQRVNSVGRLTHHIQLLQIQIFQVLQITLSNFINLFKACPGSCAHACFYPWSTRTARIYYRLLVSATLLRVGCQGGYSSRLYPSNTGTVGFCPLLFIFTRCISKPWIFTFSGFSAVYNLDIHFKDPLLMVLLRLNFSNVIGGGSGVFRDSCSDFLSLEIPARAADVLYSTNIIGGL